MQRKYLTEWKKFINEQTDLGLMGKKLIELAEKNADILNQYPEARAKLMEIINHPNYPDNIIMMGSSGYAGIPEYIGYKDAVAIYNYAMNFTKKQNN